MTFPAPDVKWRAVLHEIKNVRQESGPGRRRWFESDGLDLIVWLSPRDEISGFQLCYESLRGPHALTWRVDGGFTHCEVDEGDATPFKNETPVLVPDGRVPWARIRGLFDERSAALEPGLREFVQEKLVTQAASGTR